MTAKEINMATSFAHTIITIKTPTQQQCPATESTQHNQLSVSHNTHKNTFCVAAQLLQFSGFKKIIFLMISKEEERQCPAFIQVLTNNTGSNLSKGGPFRHKQVLFTQSVVATVPEITVFNGSKIGNTTEVFCIYIFE